MLDNCWRYTISFRLINTLALTVNFYTNKTQLCFCQARPFFFEHCVFTDKDFNEYQCFPTTHKKVWGPEAIKRWDIRYPDKKGEFNLIDRSLYDCLSGDDEEMWKIDRDDTTYESEINSKVVDTNMFLGNLLNGTIISQWFILTTLSMYIIRQYYKQR